MNACESNNCDFTNRMKDLESGKPISYGKALLTSDEPYFLWDKKTDTFNMDRILYLYSLFKENIKILKEDFPHKWVHPTELLYATKGKIWDWTTEEEFIITKNSIEEYGMYFPLFVLPQGILHNQICSLEEMKYLESLQKYNAYNGNHRIDVLQHLNNIEEVLIIQIPLFCEKSCTGFKYTPIDYRSKNKLTSYKLKQPVSLFHLSHTEKEMKMYHVQPKKILEDGVAILEVDDYNTAFRILTAFQNVLEPPLTRYYQLYNKLPEGLDCDCFNIKKEWEKYVS